MPIYGLTDGAPSFKEIGRIRLGSPKQKKTNKSGQEYEIMGRDLDHFRVTFRDDEQEALRRFVERYGDKPTMINVRLAFPEVRAAWSAWYTCHLKGGMLGRADGRQWDYLRDYRSQQVLIRNGELTALGRERGIKLEFDPEEPVYFYHSRNKDEDVPVYAKPEGRLSVVLPELGVMAYLTMITHGKNHIHNIDGQLAGISVKARDLGISLTQIPLILSRRPEQISKPLEDGRVYDESWLVNLEIHPDFAGAALRYLDAAAARTLSLAAPSSAAPVPALGPGNWEEDGDEEELPEEGEIVGGGQIEGGTEMKEEPKPERPYSPQTLKSRFEEAVKKSSNGASESDRKVVASVLDAVFDGEKTKRYEMTKWLCGESSTKKLSGAQIKALMRWLEIASFGDMPSPHAITEARQALDEALKAAGQGELGI